MPLNKLAWKGLLKSPRAAVEPRIQVVQLNFFPDRSSAGAFNALCSDKHHRYVKSVDNPQENPTIPLNDYLVGKLGRIIGAPVCEVELVAIPDMLRAVRPNGMPIAPGVASGSLDIGREAILVHDLGSRHLDDNQRRHCGILALCEWCAATDHQWLAVGSQMEYHSHDHGNYFTSAMWDSGSNLVHSSDECFLPPFRGDGLDLQERDRLVAVLRSDLRPQLVEVLQSVPHQWPITNDSLEDLGAFLEHRALRTADMLDDV